MRRDFYLFSDEEQLVRTLARQGNAESVLGVGFFSASPILKPGSGIELRVTPEGPKSLLLQKIDGGTFSPFDGESVFLGTEAREERLADPAHATISSVVTSWLLSGVPELPADTPPLERILAALEGTCQKSLSFRASYVLFSLDFSLFLGSEDNPLRESLLRDVLLWFSEETVHPSLMFVAPPGVGFRSLLAAARAVRLRSPHGEAIRFVIP